MLALSLALVTATTAVAAAAPSNPPAIEDQHDRLLRNLEAGQAERTQAAVELARSMERKLTAVPTATVAATQAAAPANTAAPRRDVNVLVTVLLGLVGGLVGGWGLPALGQGHVLRRCDAPAVWVVTIPYRWTGHTRLHQLRPPKDQTLRMQIRTRTMVAWSLWLAAFGCCAAGLAVALAVTRPLTLAVLAEGAVYALAFPLAYGTIGLVLTLRRPANPIGWVYAAAGLVWSLPIPLDPWVDQLIRDRRPLPLAAQLAAVAGEFLWAPSVVLAVTLPFLLLPDGRLRSRRWRVVVAASVTGAAIVLGAGSVLPGQLSDQTPIVNPFGLAGTGATVVTGLFSLGLALHMASLLAALACVVLRFRSSRGVERQQLRWVAAGASASVAGLLLSTLIALRVVPGAADVVVTTALLCLPVAIAVAVLRYRLWDLDRLVSRTVTYTMVTGLLVLPYLLVLPAVTRLVEGSGSLAVAGLTLAGAAVFAPLRRRVQDLVDRRFNRRRYHAAHTVDAFAVRLREQVDLDALNRELLGVVDQTMQPTQASLWLRPPHPPGQAVGHQGRSTAVIPSDAPRLRQSGSASRSR